MIARVATLLTVAAISYGAGHGSRPPPDKPRVVYQTVYQPINIPFKDKVYRNEPRYMERAIPASALIPEWGHPSGIVKNKHDRKGFGP